MVASEEKQALLEDFRDGRVNGLQDNHLRANWRRILSGVAHAIVLSATAFALLFLTTRSGSHTPNTTIEERVDNILSSTPLFGSSSAVSDGVSDANHDRRPQ